MPDECLECEYYCKQVKYHTDRGTAWEYGCKLDECRYDKNEDGEEE